MVDKRTKLGLRGICHLLRRSPINLWLRSRHDEVISSQEGIVCNRLFEAVLDTMTMVDVTALTERNA